MAQTATPAPAKAAQTKPTQPAQPPQNGEPKPDTATRDAALTFDFSKVAVEDASLPGITRTTETGPNPFLDAVQQSYDTKTGKSITVPKAAVQRAIYLIRAAAGVKGLGVRIVKPEKPDAQGNVKVLFQGKDKKKYTARSGKGDQPPQPAQS